MGAKRPPFCSAARSLVYWRPVVEAALPTFSRPRCCHTAQHAAAQASAPAHLYRGPRASYSALAPVRPAQHQQHRRHAAVAAIGATDVSSIRAPCGPSNTH